jgi:UDP-N-acetylglucosamine 2-epimerase (non-hydrolysing)
MTDVCLRVRDGALERGMSPIAGLHPGEYLVATIHRAENTDDPDRLREVVGGLAAIELPVLVLAHPRLRDRCAAFGIDLAAGNMRVAEPLPYPQMVAAVLGSRGVVTDSGGLQKEAYVLARPCTTVRTETEWVETLESGWNVLVPDAEGLADIATRAAPVGTPPPVYGDGTAARSVARVLLERVTREP